jgi:hypothetical protein
VTRTLDLRIKSLTMRQLTDSIALANGLLHSSTQTRDLFVPVRRHLQPRAILAIFWQSEEASRSTRKGHTEASEHTLQRGRNQGLEHAVSFSSPPAFSCRRLANCVAPA